MRLPYASDKPSDNSDVQAIYGRIEARRAPRPLQALDLALLHSPNVADGWNSFLGAVRTKTSLDDGVREIAICRVAVLNGATYEWEHHAPLAKKGGVSEEGIHLLALNTVHSRAAEGPGLDEKQWAIVKYTDAMTKDVKVPDDVFADLKKHFSDQEVVEITATVAAYNCVSRFLVALDVGEKNGSTISASTTSH